MRNSNQILHGDQPNEKKIFTESTAPQNLALAKIFAIRMLTRDLFTVADLFVNRSVEPS